MHNGKVQGGLHEKHVKLTIKLKMTALFHINGGEKPKTNISNELG
jgi:hypothetical protein